MHYTGKEGQRGAIFVLTMIMMILCSGLLTAMYITAHTDNRNAIRKTRQVVAMTSAESAISLAAKHLSNAFANYQSPPLSGTMTINNTSVSWTVQTALDSGGNEIGVSTLTRDGLNTLSKLYIMSASCTFENVFARAQTYISLDAIPIFQFLSFYDTDLEIFPGADMNLNGRIHTNGNLFMGSDNALKLHTGHIRTAGNFWRYRKDAPGTRPTNLYLKDKNGNFSNVKTNEDSAWTGTYDGVKTDWATMVLDKFDGNLMSGAHGVSKIESPAVGAVQPYVPKAGAHGDYTYSGGTWNYTPGTGTHDKGSYHSWAGLVVADTNIYVSGQKVTPDANVFVTKTMYDGRENKSVKVTEIDMNLLKTAKGTLPNGTKVDLWPSNGLIYGYRSDATTSAPNGIRLKNGSELKTKLTVVSPDPTYIKGDYNTVNKKGAAVISDAVNMLSNSWNDSKTSGSLPTPSDTTYNVAIMSGNLTTSVGKYNGGFENFPRFHENWSGKTAKIRGSFVNLWESEVARGQWVYGGDNYTAPNRDWNFDTDFLDINKLPPYTPKVYTTRNIAWWRTGSLPFSIFVTK